MANIITRASKGSALTWDEGDSNLINLNQVKLEASNSGSAGDLLSINQSGFVVWAPAPATGLEQKVLANIVGSSEQIIDSWASTSTTSAKYFIQIKDGANIQVQEIIMFYDGTNVYFNEYGQMANNSLLGSFDASVSGSNVRLLFTPNAANSMSVRIARTLMA